MDVSVHTTNCDAYHNTQFLTESQVEVNSLTSFRPTPIVHRAHSNSSTAHRNTCRIGKSLNYRRYITASRSQLYQLPLSTYSIWLTLYTNNTKSPYFARISFGFQTEDHEWRHVISNGDNAMFTLEECSLQLSLWMNSDDSVSHSS
jgi:hypothetical protein